MEVIYGVGKEYEAEKIRENNILRVERIDRYGHTVGWEVLLKRNGNLHIFHNHKEGAWHNLEEFPFEDLPEEVQKFVSKRQPVQYVNSVDVQRYKYKNRI